MPQNRIGSDMNDMQDDINSATPSDTVADGIAPNHFGSTYNVQVYPIKNPKWRLVKANESVHLDYNVALIEMSLHTPASTTGNYDVRRIWVALPNGENLDAEGCNKVTALPLYQALTKTVDGNKTSPHNCADIHGQAIKLNVPGLKWDQKTDAKKAGSLLLNEKKVVESDVLLSNADGLIPGLSFDHTMTLKHPELDYEQVRENHKGRFAKLAPHPVMNNVSGYMSIDPTAEVPAFHKNAGTQKHGIDKTLSGTKRYYFVGTTYRNSMRNCATNTTDFTMYDGNNSTEDRSKINAFREKLNDGVVNEVIFNGSLRIHPMKTGAVLFRINVAGFTVLNSGGVGQVSEGQEVGDVGSLNDIYGSDTVDTVDKVTDTDPLGVDDMSDATSTKEAEVIETKEPETIHDITYMQLTNEQVLSFAQSPMDKEQLIGLSIEPSKVDKILIMRASLGSNTVDRSKEDLNVDDQNPDNYSDKELEEATSSN